MNKTFLGAICGEPGNYGIVFLDLPGCTSAGDTLEEVKAMGAEALTAYIETRSDYGEPVSEPTNHTLSDVIEWLRDPEDSDDHGPWVELVPIGVDLPERSDTVPLRIKADLVDRIAELSRATARQIDSARFIEQAVEHEIERYRKSAA